MNVDAVHERAGDAALVLGDDARRAGAGAGGVAVIAARAGVHGGHQLEVGGEGERSLGAADGDDLVFKRLAQHLESAAAELGELVEEENAAVRQGDLAGMRPVATAHQAGVADGVVRGAEGAALEQRNAVRQRVSDGVDAGDVQRLLQGHVGQDGGQGARHERFASTRRADHQQIMSAGRGDLESTLYVLLSLDLAEIGLYQGLDLFHLERRLGGMITCPIRCW